jgi:plastocyanin
MVKIHFAKTGVFGYACSKHPEMKGAVLVVP